MTIKLKKLKRFIIEQGKTSGKKVGISYNKRHNQSKLWESLKQEGGNDLIFSQVRQQSIPILPVDPSDSSQNKSFEDATKGIALIKFPFKNRFSFKKQDKRNT
jgi:hypothetical protein